MRKPPNSAAVTELRSRGRRQRAAALATYIRSAKNEITVFDADWDDAQWKGVGVFVKLGGSRGAPKANIPPEELLDAGFIDFAKAYIRERHSHNPGESRAQHIDRFCALRLTEAVLLELHGSADPLLIGRDVLDRAVVLARQHYSRQTLYKAGRALEVMALALVEKGVLPLELKEWVSSLPAYRSVGTTVGSDGDKARLGNLPDVEALEVLAAIFSRDLDVSDDRYHRDIYTTSVAALLLSAPSRGQEVHQLPADLLVKATDKFGEEQTGLRLHASKGFGAYVKWVWSGMVPVAQKAIDRVRAITEEARALARHLENSKTRKRFFRHADCPDVGEDEPLTATQVCLALGWSTSKPHSKLHSMGLSGAFGAHTLNSLWNDWVLPRQKKSAPYFPYVSKEDKALGSKGGLKFSEALFCMQVDQLSTWGTTRVLLWMPSLSTGFAKDVAPSREGKSRSIFDRYGYTRSDGSPLKLASHQLRHLLNTEAQRVELPDDMIAHWSGRLKVRQNDTYDNRPEQERVDQVRPLIEALDARLGNTVAESDGSQLVQSGPWSIEMPVKPRSCADLDDIQPRLAGIKTLYGECYHDWALAPCEGLITCLDCEEHGCVKGPDELRQGQLERAEQLYQQVVAEVTKAQAAVAEEAWGAQEWLAVQQRYAAKLEQLLTLLKSADVPDGSVIRLASGQHPTHLHRVLRSIAVKALEDGSSAPDVMRRMLSAISHAEQGTQPIKLYRPSLEAIKGLNQHEEENGS